MLPLLRVQYVQQNVSWITCFLVPILVGLSFTFLSPWLRLYFSKIVRAPTIERKKMNVSSEYELVKMRNNLAKQKKIETERIDLENMKILLNKSTNEIEKYKNMLADSKLESEKLESDAAKLSSRVKNLEHQKGTSIVELESYKDSLRSTESKNTRLEAGATGLKSRVKDLESVAKNWLLKTEENVKLAQNYKQKYEKAASELNQVKIKLEQSNRMLQKE